MPIYEYVCKSCGFEKDVLQKMNDEALSVCPSCDEASFTKRISAAGFRLSGSGWYETDFKTGSKKNLSKAVDSKSGSGAEGGTAAQINSEAINVVSELYVALSKKFENYN